MMVAMIVVIAFTYSVAGAFLPVAYAQPKPSIRVHVVDQNAHDYENVVVQIWRGVLIDSGKTDSDGLWMTYLEGDGRFYEVRVFNGHSMSKTVQVIRFAVFVELFLERLAPAPLLMVSNVDYPSAGLSPGAAADVQIQITNIGSLDAVSSLLTFTAFPAHVSLLENGTVFSLGALKVGTSLNSTVKLYADSYAAAGSYQIQYELSCLSDTGYSYHYEGAFGIFVVGIPEVGIHDVRVDPSTLTRGTDGTLTLELMNSGTDVAESVVVRMYNAEILTSTTNYAGKIERGKVVDLTFGVHVDKKEDLGVHVLNMTVTYMDRNGDRFAESKLYQIKVVLPASLLQGYDVSLAAISIALAAVLVFSLRRLRPRF